MTNEELVQYYANLLIIQYRDKERAAATTEAVLRALIPVEVAEAVRDGFSLSASIGQQLDTLGKYIGADRIITGSAFTRDYWGYSEYTDTAPFTFFPYMAYGQIAPDVQMRRYEESQQGLFSLNDVEFRFILRLKLVINNSNASPATIDGLIQELFAGSAIFTDRLDMTISYIFAEADARLVAIALSEDLLAKPAAVGIITSTTPDIHNIFGYTFYGEEPAPYVVGYGAYSEDTTGGWVFYG